MKKAKMAKMAKMTVSSKKKVVVAESWGAQLARWAVARYLPKCSIYKTRDVKKKDPVKRVRKKKAPVEITPEITPGITQASLDLEARTTLENTTIGGILATEGEFVINRLEGMLPKAVWPGRTFDVESPSEYLNVPVIEVSAPDLTGLDDIWDGKE